MTETKIHLIFNINNKKFPFTLMPDKKKINMSDVLQLYGAGIPIVYHMNIKNYKKCMEREKENG
jgi:hypothetical protein